MIPNTSMNPFKDSSEIRTTTAPIPPVTRPPGNRAYAVIHWSFMGLIALIVFAENIAPRILPVPRPAGFRLVIAAMICMNVLWWSVADRRFARYVRSARASAALRMFVAVFSIALNTPLIYMIVAGRFPAFINTAPTWYAAAVTIWQLGLIIVMPVVACIRILLLSVISLARWFGWNMTGGAPPASDKDINLHRRAILKTAFGSVPMLVLAGGTSFAQVQSRRLQVNRHQVTCPWLPPRLRGLTITQVSDLHVGRLYRPEMLPYLVDQVNRLNSDILVLTGDIVDISNDMLPPALEAISQMHHRHGAFACIGNHDEFDNRAEFIRAVRKRLPLLIDERRTLDIGGERLTLAGIDWARFDQQTGGRSGHQQHVINALAGHELARDGPIIALAHHPHAWDSLALQAVPLVLSGHTHGGQVMLNAPDIRPDIGAGAMLFRYVRGFYQKPDSTLFVNRGVGNWFPVRINSPAEIVQLQLV